MVRKHTKRDEKKARYTLIKNGKYFVRPMDDGRDFKALFTHLASTGAGRPVDANGFPKGPWTPDLLAEAISKIDANTSGIELRTVQLWFQDNVKGISTDNIRWLARVFGCDDPEATSAWQSQLSAAQARLAAKRRHIRQRSRTDAKEPTSGDSPIALNAGTVPENQSTRQVPTIKLWRSIGLARKTEALFGHGSHLDLPASVCAGAIALGFTSYFLGIHSVTYSREDGVTKQAGFLWAPNWTFLFMIFMPLFFAVAIELLSFWKNVSRARILAGSNGAERDVCWAHKVEAASYTFWMALLICVGFAGLFQWVSVRLIPFSQGGGDYAIDWGSLAIARPEIISVPQQIMFTGFAYLYMCICFYLFFAGFILLYTIALDFSEISRTPNSQVKSDSVRNVTQTGLRIMRGTFRCAVLGMMIAICMKLQALYLKTAAESIPDWIIRDTLSVLRGRGDLGSPADYTTPTHYSSLLVALASGIVFLSACTRIGFTCEIGKPLSKMAAAMTVLTVGYLLIGAFSGFSILLCVAILLAVYGLFDPEFGRRPVRKSSGYDNVS